MDSIQELGQGTEGRLLVSQSAPLCRNGHRLWRSRRKGESERAIDETISDDEEREGECRVNLAAIEGECDDEGGGEGEGDCERELLEVTRIVHA